MPDKFDPYREALVVEADTIWPEELDDWDVDRRLRLEAQLHSAPDEAESLEYVRMHTGFCRRITVTPADIERLS